MRNNPEDKTRLQHIYDAILEIEKYIKDSSLDEFQSNSMMQFASAKQLEIIGEAANHLSEHFKKLYKGIQWKEIIGLRNILIHEYFGIDTKIIWDVIKVDLPEVKSRIKDMLNQI